MAKVEGYVHPAFAPVATYFNRVFGKLRRRGGAVAVRMGGDQVVELWAGFADPDSAEPWTEDTLCLGFSTTKGLSTTVLHRLADRGLLEYDRPVADYWPEFAANGKGHITVAELMSHRAGLYRLGDVATSADEVLDHEEMEHRLAAAAPYGYGVPAYHAVTYGWLVAGLVRSITGMSLKAAVRAEVTEPLGLTDAIALGLPDAGETGIARPLFADLNRFTAMGKYLHERNDRGKGPYLASAASIYVPGIDTIFDPSSLAVLGTEMGAANGLFTADGLARLYAPLANRGVYEGQQYLSPGTVEKAGTVQVRGRDRVIGIDLKWRLGYHQAISFGRPARRGFGHFGLGGSGGWADPDTGMSIGFVTNFSPTPYIPVGDQRLYRLGGIALACARRYRALVAA